MPEVKFPLSLAKPGERLVIERITMKPAMVKRMEAMGFRVGVKIEVIGQQVSFVVVRIGETRLSLTSDISRRIEVKYDN